MQVHHYDQDQCLPTIAFFKAKVWSPHLQALDVVKEK
jgi:hypothetical protein